MADGLLDLVGHAPDTDQFSADFSEITPDACLFHYHEPRPEITGFD